MASSRPSLWLSVGLPLSLVQVAGALLLSLQNDWAGRLLILAVVIFATLWLCYGLSKRLRSISRRAVRIAEGGTRSVLPMAPERELADLATAINTMGERLGSSESQLRAKTNELDAILQSMHAGVVALDREQRILALNGAAADMLGLLDKPVTGSLIHEVARFPPLLRFISDAMSMPGAADAEIEIAGTARRFVRASGGVLRDADGRNVGVVLVLTDMTQLRRLEAMRTDFAANVSHELRTPITNIKGYTETLLEVGLSDPDLATKFLKIVATNADRLGAIVEDMLALTNLERAEAEDTLVTTPTPIAHVIEAARNQVESAAKAKRISVTCSASPELLALVNARLVEQAISNLIDNAIKYSPAGTRVNVTASRVERGGGRWVEVAISDEGPGIAAEHLARIFERFYRVDKARSREQGGTGLGLAIVKHIALVHGGQISVESTLAKGSTFRLTLPGS